MTDEAAAAAAAAAAPLVEIIKYSVLELTSVGVIHKINECVSRNKQIELKMEFFDRFDATVAMQNTIVRNSRHIKKILMQNICNEKEEHSRCFNFCTKIVQGIIGNWKHLTYVSYRHGFELEQANQLAQALLQSNNNNNDAIESFHLHDANLTPVIFQLLWNALLDSGVRKIRFGSFNYGDPSIHYTNNNIDFTGMKTNTSLKELNLTEYHMREEDYRNLFNSMKVNKGLVGLHFCYTTYKDLSEEMKRLFQEMMCENITLRHFKFEMSIPSGDEQDRILEMIQFHMKVNRMWKRYVMKREHEKKTPAVIPGIEERDHNNNDENERKKRFRIRMLLHLFMKKPVMRNTIIFHLLSEYPDELVRNNNNDGTHQQQQSPLLLRISISSNLTKNKRKRTTDDDGENKSNEGTNDPNDNGGVINLCDSESDDGTDGTL